MRDTRSSTRLGFTLAAILAIGACKSETPETDQQPSEGPRSIFQEAPSEEDGGVQLPPLETVLSFADGTPELTQSVRAELATVIDSPQVEGGGRITLRGHTDTQGADAENLEASRGYAEAVRDFLVENGIDEERIAVIAFGEQNPVAPNALPDGAPNEEGRAANRRVELKVETGPAAKRQQTLIETLTEETDEPEGAPATGPSATPSPAA